MIGLVEEAGRQAAVERSDATRLRGDPELNRIVEFVAARYDASFAAVSIISGSKQLLLSRCGADFEDVPRKESFCAVAIHRPGEPMIVPDASKDARFADNALVLFTPYVRFYAGMPIVDRGGYALGALCVADRRPRDTPFDPTYLLIMAHEVERHIWR